MIDLDALRRGEPAAVDAFYRRHARTVLAWTLRLGGPHIDAEDVAQEVMLKALHKVAGLQTDRLESWLFGVTRRVVANARRKAQLRRFFSLSEGPEPIDPAVPMDAELARIRRRRRVQEVLMTLSVKHREVMVLADLEGRTAPEVAEILGISVGTVYSRLHHARKSFGDTFVKRGGKAMLGGLVAEDS